MTKFEASKLASLVTPKDLKQMFLNAQQQVTDWKEVSRINKGMTKGTAFNILTGSSSFEETTIINDIVKRNMIWEFGEYLPQHIKLTKEEKESQIINPVHQEPKFLK